MLKNICLSVILFFLIVGASVLTPACASNENDEIASVRKTSKAFTQIAKKVMPTVVFIKVEQAVKTRHGRMPNQYNNPFDLYNDDFLERFFGYKSPRTSPQRERKQIGQGSGFIISEDGLVLTNHHVVGEADKITVILNDGREYEAEKKGTDPKSDVAIIQIKDARELPVLKLGDSDSLEVGEWVMAVGNPFGLSHTITVGIVSAKGRNSVGISDYEDFIQTDAAINPGNSGGPLINIDGEAVGINSAIFSRSGGYMGIGFAIPMNMVKLIKNQLINKGVVSRGYLGVVIQDLDKDLITSFGLKENTEGVLIADVAENSPAEKSGMQRGDVVTSFNDNKVTGVRQFRNIVGLIEPGQKTKLSVIRDGKVIEIKVKLGSLEDSEFLTAGSSDILEKLGLSVQDLTADIAAQLGYKNKSGVLISEVEAGSPAQNTGMKPGMLILEVNRKEVKDVEDLVEALEKSKQSKKVMMLFRDKKYSKYVMLDID